MELGIKKLYTPTRLCTGVVCLFLTAGVIDLEGAPVMVDDFSVGQSVVLQKNDISASSGTADPLSPLFDTRALQLAAANTLNGSDEIRLESNPATAPGSLILSQSQNTPAVVTAALNYSGSVNLVSELGQADFSNYQFEVDIVSNDLSQAIALVAELSSPGGTASYTTNLPIGTIGTLTLAFNIDTGAFDPSAVSGLAFSTSLAATSGGTSNALELSELRVTAVPESSATALIAFGLTAGLILIRLRAKQA